ncbi:hypothetical protein [Christiangramia aquimixticola]|uniref:hypothetical protein n=1 Tax=Christiangramia aquimixticola TaxID=1697558 RepID=UPI003AA8B9E8
MFTFYKRILIIAAPILFLIIGVNYFGDAAKIFHDDYEKQITKILENGDYVTNIRNYNERILQEELVKGKQKAPDVLVIGSSRTMLIDSSYYKGRSFFNSSVSAASLQDLIAIYQIYSSFDKLPKKIIIGVDPWTFKENSERNRWEAISFYYYDFYGRENQNNSQHFSQLISLSYFQASWKSLLSVWGNNDKPIATHKFYNKTNTKLNDGSISYGEEFRSASKSKVETRAKEYSVGELIRRYKHYTEMSPEKIDEFQHFISHLKQRNIEIEFFLGPYHPITYEVINENFEIFNEVENFMRDFSRKHTIKIYGSFNPKKYHLGGEFFFDEKHLTKKGIEKILRE